MIPLRGWSRALLPGVAWMALLLAPSLLLPSLTQSTAPTWLVAQLQWLGAAQGVGLWLLAVLTMLVGLPRQVVAYAAGQAWGLWPGLVWALGATLLASVASYALARLAVQCLDWRPPAGRLLGLLQGHTFRTTLLLRLLPVGSNLGTNLAAGGIRLPCWPFLGGSALGYLPQTLVFTLLGSGLEPGAGWRLAAALGLFLAAGLLGLGLWRRYQGADWPGAVPGGVPG